MPKGGSWTALKNEATDFVQGTGSADITPASLLTNFIRAAGGLAGLMRGHGGAAPSGSGATRTSAGTKGATGGVPQPEHRPPSGLRGISAVFSQA